MHLVEAYRLLKPEDHKPDTVAKALIEVYSNWNSDFCSCDITAQDLGLDGEAVTLQTGFVTRLRRLLRIARIRKIPIDVQETIAQKDPYGYYLLLDANLHHKRQWSKIVKDEGGYLISKQALRVVQRDGSYHLANKIVKLHQLEKDTGIRYIQ